MLEVLHRALVLFRGCPCAEGPQVAALAGLGIDLTRIQSITTGLELPDHDCSAAASAAVTLNRATGKFANASATLMSMRLPRSLGFEAVRPELSCA